MVGGESDYIASICCKMKSTMHNFDSPIFRKTQSPSCHLRHRKFQIFYIMKMFEQAVESELGDSSGEYEAAAEGNSCDRGAGAVRDVISDVTKLEFLGPRTETKTQSCSERFGGAQAVAKSPCE